MLALLGTLAYLVGIIASESLVLLSMNDVETTRQ